MTLPPAVEWELARISRALGMSRVDLADAGLRLIVGMSAEARRRFIELMSDDDVDGLRERAIWRIEVASDWAWLDAYRGGDDAD